MTETSWLPVVTVLLIGLAAGLIAAWRMKWPRSRQGLLAADRALRLADLERRREALFERLRSGPQGADRERLERSAAHVLRQIDELREQAPDLFEDAAPVERTEDATATAVGTRSGAAGEVSRGHTLLVGFLSGTAMMALIGLLIYWALDDTRPNESVRPSAPEESETEHPRRPLPQEARDNIEALRLRFATNPSDISTHKQLALALLSAQQYLEAFRLAEQLLATFPDDPDGLYVAGIVRMTMGQDDVAMAHLDRVVKQYPNHLLALAGQGMILLRSGDAEAAGLVFERALEVAGGRHPELEDLLRAARAGERSPGVQPPARDGVTRESVPPDGYGIRLELTVGRSVPPTPTLFVFLRSGEEGPPAAVKRIQNPVFPLEIVLGPDDSMLGRPLPTEGTISARLDSDGSASTRDESDLAAETATSAGSRVVLVLDD